MKEVEFGHVDAELRVKPNLPVLGPRLGKELGAVRAALQAGAFEELGDGRFRAAGHELGPDEVLVERAGEGRLVGRRRRRRHGRASTPRSTRRSLLEGRVYELIHRVNSMRKEAGLELTDRIALTIGGGDDDLLAHRDWIAKETLAVSVEVGDTPEPAIRVT